MLINRRYSEFEDLHQKLLQTFPHAASSMPQFPPKSVICKSHTPRGHCICPIRVYWLTLS